MKKLTLFTLGAFLSFCAVSQVENTNTNKFKQLYEELPTPNVYRTAAGAPGHQYYQQKADYKMKISIDAIFRKL